MNLLTRRTKRERGLMLMAIEVGEVTKRFGDFTALENVSVAVEDGALTALLGPSGSGKSTLLRIIAGLEIPDTGSVTIAGQDVDVRPARAARVGFVFQHYAPFKHMTVHDNVAFGLSVRKHPKAQIARARGELLRPRAPGRSSQSLPLPAIGRAVAAHGARARTRAATGVLLLDEPFGALDAQVRAELREWLRRLHEEIHVTTIFVTHDQEEAMEVAAADRRDERRADRAVGQPARALRESQQRVRDVLHRARQSAW